MEVCIPVTKRIRVEVMDGNLKSKLRVLRVGSINLEIDSE